MEDRWFDEELSGCRLGDGRLDSRLRQLVEQMESGFGESIPLACQDWANTKAAYRFFSNDRVSEEDILRGHFDATRRRFAASDGPILILHDTTEFSWRRRRPEGQIRSRPHAHGLRAADAFEPGGDDGRVAAGNGRGQVGADRVGDKHPRPPDFKSDRRSFTGQNSLALSHQDRQARRLSRPCQGPAARQHRHVARPLPVERHCPRGHPPD